MLIENVFSFYHKSKLTEKGSGLFPPTNLTQSAQFIHTLHLLLSREKASGFDFLSYFAEMDYK